MPQLPDDKLPDGADPDVARAYIEFHDARAVQCDAMSDLKLKLLYNEALALRGMTSLFGGPDDHDSLVNYIVDLEFPDVQKARDIWYAHVRMPAIGQE